MTETATYRCTKCRRTKDIEVSNVHVLLSHCTITKGCQGTLQRAGALDTGATPIVSSAELVDWYPRGQTSNVVPVPQPEKRFSLANSSSGVLCIAVPETTVDQLFVEFERKTTFGITSQEFVKTIQVESNEITGRDDQNRIIRFEPDVISQNRIRVVANGVQIENFTATQNSIVFADTLTVGTNVIITVFGSSPVEKITVLFTRNAKTDYVPPSSAWSKSTTLVRTLSGFADGQVWSIFTSASFSVEADSELRVSSADPNAIFLLSLDPYSEVDRNSSIHVKLSNLTGTSFPLQKASGISSPLLCPMSAASSDSIPFKMQFTGAVSQNTISTQEQIIPVNSKIIGPT